MGVRHKKEEVVTILEELDFTWTVEQMDNVKRYWNEGKSLLDIRDIIKRTDEEVFLLLLHLSKKGRISKRDKWVWQGVNK